MAIHPMMSNKLFFHFLYTHSLVLSLRLSLSPYNSLYSRFNVDRLVILDLLFFLPLFPAWSIFHMSSQDIAKEVQHFDDGFVYSMDCLWNSKHLSVTEHFKYFYFLVTNGIYCPQIELFYPFFVCFLKMRSFHILRF